MPSFKSISVRVKPEEIIKGLAGLKPLHAYHIYIDPEVLPIIIIPGFMGTKLYSVDNAKKEKIIVWDPDLPKDMAKKYGNPDCNAKDKKRAFIGEKGFNENYLHIENYNNPNNYYLHDCISKTFYGYLINELSNAGTWTSYQQFFAELPVYSFPYNWTDDNVNSAKKLSLYVEKIINSYQVKGKRCERVILITHSMGGLVARYACKNFISEKVLGVIHVAQPANGAASTFWRMKCGVERSDKSNSIIKNHIVSWTLGTNGKETTALLGNMPSALQTLPNCQYTDNQGDFFWLKCVNQNNQPFIDKQVQDSYSLIDLPQHGDPYEEIYKKFDQCHYLIDKDYLSPGKPKLTTRLLMEYLKNIDKAKEFHNNIENYSHPLTFNIYGRCDGYSTVDRIYYQVVVREPILVEECESLMKAGKTAEAEHCYVENHDIISHDTVKRDFNLWLSNRGGFKKVIIESSDKMIEIGLRDADGEGDGTVSVSSGMALLGKGGNDFDNTNYVYNLKHDAAMSGGTDRHSRDCIKMIINNVKSILQQQIDKYKAEHPDCKIIEG